MLDKFRRLLFGKDENLPQTNKTNSELPRQQDRSKQLIESNAVDSFLSSLNGIGHSQYPILDRKYSPSSRVPCTDLVPFITKRLIEGDTSSIKTIMRAMIEGNPGLGLEVSWGTSWEGSWVGSWIDDCVDKVQSTSFENYVSFSSSKALPELKALFIVAAKGGGNSEFLITEGIPRLISWACIAHQPSWSAQLETLAKKANSWIAEMAKDIPYWKEYERFDISEVPSSTIETALRAIILSLTPAARLHLFYTIERGGGSLPNLTNYQIRSLGINTERTSKELIESGLVMPSASKDVIESSHSKQELVDLCETHGATYRKSWKKEKLVEALQKLDSVILWKIAESKSLVLPN